ncbi:hypothetical protein AX17_000415 [Amanita inopinata Kibby_2008]|nr:hypothetical protein AX17_000415 [Amanita inopinata Kibby_2008]
MIFSARVLRTVSDISYAFLVLIITTATALSCAALLSQAVRTAPNRSWSHNFNAFVIGASYAAVLIASLMLCVKRRVAVRLRLQRISKAHKAVGRGDVPQIIFSTADDLAHKVIPSHPSLKPHARMLHHFRFIIPLLPRDKDGLTPLHYYDSVIQIARNASDQLTEREFETGMEAAEKILQNLSLCLAEDGMQGELCASLDEAT